LEAHRLPGAAVFVKGHAAASSKVQRARHFALSDQTTPSGPGNVPVISMPSVVSVLYLAGILTDGWVI
jgi:hypothetical protein